MMLVYDVYVLIIKCLFVQFIVFALFVAAAVAVPVDPKDATIVRYDNDNIGVEGFNYA